MEKSSFETNFNDKNVADNGVSINYLTANYYNIGQYVSTYNYDYNDSCYKFTVNYYGIDYNNCKLKISASDLDWTNEMMNI